MQGSEPCETGSDPTAATDIHGRTCQLPSELFSNRLASKNVGLRYANPTYVQITYNLQLTTYNYDFTQTDDSG